MGFIEGAAVGPIQRRVDRASFRLSRPHPVGMALFRGMVAASVITFLGFSLFFLVVSSPADILWVGGFLVIVVPLWLWQSRGWYQAEVLLAPDALIVRYSTGDISCAWDDIESVRVRSFRSAAPSDYWLSFVTGANTHIDVAEVRLTRVLRRSLTGGDLGTAIRGIPLPFRRTVHLYVDDPSVLCAEVSVRISSEVQG